jgi:hypothetical protein
LNQSGSTTQIVSSRILHEKWNANFFLASYAFRSKVFKVKKIRDPEKKFIPDPGGKKEPDPDPQH